MKSQIKIDSVKMTTFIVSKGIFVISTGFFEIMNFLTTYYALNHLLGSMSFMGISWGTILSAAFVCADFGALYYLFSNPLKLDEMYVKLLLGLWIIAAVVDGALSFYTYTQVMLDKSPQTTGVELHGITFILGAAIILAAGEFLIRFLLAGATSETNSRTPQHSLRVVDRHHQTGGAK
jgi:hypothetical protein